MTAELAQGIAAAKKDWTVLVFPQVAVGASGYNEVGGHFTFPGTYAVRPSTLRAVFMDLASELGDQGFRWIFVVHVHGAPRHNRVLDQAGDSFHDTYGGRMVHLWGLLPVVGAWGKELQTLTVAERKEEGVALHAGGDETSLMLHLAPELAGARRGAGRHPGHPGDIDRDRGGRRLAGLPRLAAPRERGARRANLEGPLGRRARPRAPDPRPRRPDEAPALRGLLRGLPHGEERALRRLDPRRRGARRGARGEAARVAGEERGQGRTVGKGAQQGLRDDCAQIPG